MESGRVPKIERFVCCSASTPNSDGLVGTDPAATVDDAAVVTKRARWAAHANGRLSQVVGKAAEQAATFGA